MNQKSCTFEVKLQLCNFREKLHFRGQTATLQLLQLFSKKTRFEAKNEISKSIIFILRLKKKFQNSLQLFTRNGRFEANTEIFKNRPKVGDLRLNAHEIA